MRRCVSDLVRQCQIYQHIKNPQQKLGKLTPIRATKPFKIVAWDITGPLPATPAGNRYILFTSEVMQVLAKCLAIILLFLSPYHPQTNGLTERMNKTIKQILNSFMDPLQQNWDQVLPFAVYAFYTSVQVSTRVSPFQSFVWTRPQAPTRPPNSALQVNPKYRDARDLWLFLQKHLPLLRYSLHQNLQIAQQRQKHNYNQGQQEVTYNDPDLVLLYYPIRRTGLSESLLQSWIGPYMILNRIPTNTYRLECTSNGSITTAHVTRMKQYEAPTHFMDRLNNNSATVEGGRCGVGQQTRTDNDTTLTEQ
ncbi:hypothetical protein KP509_14G047800 [Ceratopteris richardii]|uniref:Integrase catalytic domain-containing protein n=1 Tax=Ceratopteris richardii TaxID=49495 RepID=A0A8T2T7N1_CERRI|nr:hypothetical protein KP509_14G047800 [Ceratopteris richardii]